MKNHISLFLLSVICLTTLGCGYQNKELFPDEFNTVAVPIFRNESIYRSVEFDLTEAIIKEIELRCPYKIVDQSAAHTIIEGTIVSVDQRMLSRQKQGGMPQEMEMTIVIDFKWKNLRTGETLRERKGLKVVGRYVPALPVGQTYELALHEAVANTAETVVSIMRSDW